ncbi:MAG: DNA-3-methyladenine glycosylase family protein, partial [Actinomycetota bacterium]
MPARTISPTDGPIDLAGTLFPLRRGYQDPTTAISGAEALRSLRTQDGPATIHLRAVGRTIEAESWGPGADWALTGAPDLVGANDDWGGFEPHHEVVRRLRHEHPGLRLTRTAAVTATLIPAICEQKVTGADARRAYRLLTQETGESAPGPGQLLLPPDPALLAELPSFAFHRCGLERRRADVVRGICARAARLDALADGSPEDAKDALLRLPGIGPWTVAEVARLALGDPDAVSVGDFHLPNLVAWLLAGEPRATDERMLELLAPYEGHRGRVQRLLEASGMHAPRYGPRAETRSIAG